MHRTDDLPDGFYLIKNKNNELSLVKLYDHPDFNGVRHIGFGAWDGGILIPVTDMNDDVSLIPVTISVKDLPTIIYDGLS